MIFSNRWSSFSVRCHRQTTLVTTHGFTVEEPKFFSPSQWSVFRGSLAAPRPARIFLMIHLSFPVSQLDLLEHRRKKFLSQCAFTVQCCWLRHQRRKRQTQQRSATLIQAGKVIDVSVFTHCQRLPTF